MKILFTSKGSMPTSPSLTIRAFPEEHVADVLDLLPEQADVVVVIEDLDGPVGHVNLSGSAEVVVNPHSPPFDEVAELVATCSFDLIWDTAAALAMILRDAGQSTRWDVDSVYDEICDRTEKIIRPADVVFGRANAA